MRILVNSESETRNNLETEVRETFRKIHRTCSSLNLLFWAPGTREPNILLLKTWIRIVKVFIEMSERHTFSSHFTIYKQYSVSWFKVHNIHIQEDHREQVLVWFNFHVHSRYILFCHHNNTHILNMLFKHLIIIIKYYNTTVHLEHQDILSSTTVS